MGVNIVNNTFYIIIIHVFPDERAKGGTRVWHTTHLNQRLGQEAERAVREEPEISYRLLQFKSDLFIT